MSDQFGRMLIGVGLTIALIGVIVLLSSNLPWFRLGRLPGDIHIEKQGFSLFFPITTMILISAVLSFIFFLIGKVKR